MYSFVSQAHNGLEKHHYACHVCDYRYTLADALTKHLIRIHNFQWPVGHTRFRLDEHTCQFSVRGVMSDGMTHCFCYDLMEKQATGDDSHGQLDKAGHPRLSLNTLHTSEHCLGDICSLLASCIVTIKHMQ